MKEGPSQYTKTCQRIIGEILDKKQFYENRMLREKEITEHLISLCNQIHAELEEIYPVIDNLKKNEYRGSAIDLIDKFKHVEILFSNMYLIYIENDLNVQNLEYFRLEIEEDIIKLRQNKINESVVPNSPNEDELSSLGSI